MRKNSLTRVVFITALIAVVSLSLAAAIGASTKCYREIFTGNPGGKFSDDAGGGGGQKLTIDEKQSLSMANVAGIHIKSSFVNVLIHDGVGKTIDVRFHGTIRTTAPKDIPHLVVNRTGDDIEIRLQQQQHAFFCWTSGEMQLDVTIPKSFAGALAVGSNSASVNLDAHHFSSLTLTTSSGDVQTGAIQAAAVMIESSSGGITTQDIAAKSVKISTSSGDIQLGAVSGNSEIESTSGGVKAQRIVADRAKISTSSGDIQLDAISGHCEMHSVSGQVTASCTQTSPAIRIDTSSGDVKLHLPPTASFTLDAHSTSGDVSCAFPLTIPAGITGERNEHQLVGTVAGGGNQVSLHTVSGGIAVEK